MADKKVYNVTEIADILQTTEPRVRKLISDGYIKSLRIGRTLVRDADLDMFLESAVGYDYLSGTPVLIRGNEK